MHAKSPYGFLRTGRASFMRILFCRKGHQCDIACALDSDSHLTLMLCAVAGNTAGQDLAALGHKTAEFGNVLVINVFYLIDAESTDLFTGLPVSVTSDQSNPSSMKELLAAVPKMECLRQGWKDQMLRHRRRAAGAQAHPVQILPAGRKHLLLRNLWNPGTQPHRPPLQ